MNKPKPAAVAPGTAEKLSNKYTTMKTLTKIALALVLLATAASSRADWVDGYTRANGTYVSRAPGTMLSRAHRAQRFAPLPGAGDDEVRAVAKLQAAIACCGWARSRCWPAIGR